jgi:DnaJ-class molecular chaperone
VARDSSLETIRRAYRKLAKLHHPDLNPSDAKAEARFRLIASAHELLSDAAKRARYDAGEIDAKGVEKPAAAGYRDYADSSAGRRYGPTGAGHSDWAGADISDLFGTMFGAGSAGRGQKTGPRRGEDQHFTLSAAFLDAVNGATKRLTLPDGRVLDVKIPPATADGDTLRLRGQGGMGDGGKGDALIEIHVRAHAYFQRDGRDIRVELPVSLSEAVLGGFIEVPTPSGKLRMRIPAGSDSQTQLRLPGRGVPAHGEHTAGDFYATLRVVVGAPDAALDAFLKGWTPAHATNPRQAMDTVE